MSIVICNSHKIRSEAFSCCHKSGENRHLYRIRGELRFPFFLKKKSVSGKQAFGKVSCRSVCFENFTAKILLKQKRDRIKRWGCLRDVIKCVQFYDAIRSVFSDHKLELAGNKNVFSMLRRKMIGEIYDLDVLSFLFHRNAYEFQ